jgi:hypothetical protein
MDQEVLVAMRSGTRPKKTAAKNPNAIPNKSPDTGTVTHGTDLTKTKPMAFN